MKFYLKLPGEIELHFEKQPMSLERFEMICWLIGIFIVGSGLLKFVELTVRR